MNKYLIIALFIMIASLDETYAQSSVAFHVSFSEPQAHYADIEMTLDGNTADFTEVKMPVWAPGSYLVREFSKNVESFSAQGADKKALTTVKLNKNTWRIDNPSRGAIKINYRVYCFEISVRTSFVDEAHAFLSPTGIFMYPADKINMPVTVSVTPFKDWKKISTGLDVVSGKANTFRAKDFDILFDTPLEIGNQDVFEFDAAGVHHEVAMVGGGNYDKLRLAEDMKRIIEKESAIYGENPNKKYVFIVHNYQKGGGGLEHLNSTVLGASRLAYSTDKGYKSFLGLVAHEYFHLWNVKRLRPKALGPFDYSNENYTRELWIAEGFTAYYDNLILCHTAAYTPEKYLEVLCEDINIVSNQPGAKVQPVTESSFDAWIKYYRPNENSKNTGISYYNKGAVLGAMLDLEILHATNAKTGLAEVMKAMYDEYYKKQQRGYTGEEFKAMAEKMSGLNLDNFYRDYVNGTSPIQYGVHLGHAGLTIINDNEGSSKLSTGLTLSATTAKLTITGVERASAAWIGGLNVNDELIAADGNRINDKAELDNLLSFKKAGDKMEMLVARDGLIKKCVITLKTDDTAKYRIVADKNATAAQMQIRKKWLGL